MTVLPGLTLAVAMCVQHPVALTVDQWRADLQYLAQQMPLKHKNLFHTMTPEAFHQAVDGLDADIPCLNDDEIAVRLIGVAAMPGDSHSGPKTFPPGNYFPLRLRHYDDGIYVESASRIYADAVGGRLVRIGNASADDVYEKILPLMPHDSGNPGLLEMIGPVLMTSGHLLHGLDVEPTADRAEFVVSKGGKERQFTVTPEIPGEMLFGHEPISGWVDARGAGTPPLWLAHPDRTFWSAYLPDKRIFYVQFNAVQNAKDETVAHFFDDVFRRAAKLPVDKFVLDIRANDGGNNALLTPIIVGLVRLQSVDRPGHLFVITSRTTYSAAQNLVNRLETYTSAIFVGQPTGQHVNSYGDPAPIDLPNSHIGMGMASVWWQDNDERDKRIETAPEIAADPTFAAYIANRDPAMDAILSYRPEASLETVILAAIRRGGTDAGLSAYRRFALDPVHRYLRPRMESRVNTLGYSLIAQQRVAEAIEVFAVNVQANPYSANAADSLGEAYADAGDKAKAIDWYRRALKINPTLQSSRDALARLGATS